MTAYRPVGRAGLLELLTDRIAGHPGSLRVAVDGPWALDPVALARGLAEAVHATGRPSAVVDARTFWKDASLRLEYGREDVEAYLSWLDAGALRREALDALPDGHYLPSLRDPDTNRMTRAEPVAAPEGTVLVVGGELLFGLGLPFELSVHLLVSPAARTRRTPPEQQWTLPALAQYDDEVDPAAFADVVVRYDDPDHPAVRD